MRLAVYTDYTYRRDAEGVSGERAFVRFMTGLRPHVERLVLVGRLDPMPGRSHYPLGQGVDFVGLPFYSSLTRPGRVLGSLASSAVRFWRVLDDVDTVWLLGPYIHAIGFAALGRMRRRTVVLGVRQDFPTYARNRHPSKRWVHFSADLMEWMFRTMARRLPVAVVGPDLARHYARTPALLELTVSLISQADLEDPERALTRASTESRRVLSVGRLDMEKNPLLLADVIAALRRVDARWQLDIAGEGAMRERLEQRLQELGVADGAVLHGYVPIDDGLGELYRKAEVFLHVSFTEGLPQVLFEAFAAGTPIVATDVGGVGEAAGDAALLIEPGDAQAAVDAILRVSEDAALRRRLVYAGSERARRHTLEAEAARLAGFLNAAAQLRRPPHGSA